MTKAARDLEIEYLCRDECRDHGFDPDAPIVWGGSYGLGTYFLRSKLQVGKPVWTLFRRYITEKLEQKTSQERSVLDWEDGLCSIKVYSP